jgi:hypothetical protein
LATKHGERPPAAGVFTSGRVFQEDAITMKSIVFSLGLLSALAAGAALGQPSRSATTSICLDPAGRTLPVSCRAKASRVEHEEYICQCLHGGEQVTIAVCPEGVRPPTDSAEYERARHAAIQRGSLIGATFQGQPICVRRGSGYPSAE